MKEDFYTTKNNLIVFLEVKNVLWSVVPPLAYLTQYVSVILITVDYFNQISLGQKEFKSKTTPQYTFDNKQ